MILLLKYFSIHIKSIMQYKVSFFLVLAGQFFVSFSVFAGVYFMFSRFNNVTGFKYNEVLLCFSIVLMSFSISESIFRGFDRFPVMIQNGEFDRVMTRPRNEILQILGMKIDISRTGRLLQAVVILVYAIPNCGVAWSFDKIGVLVLMIIGGISFFSGLFMIYAGIPGLIPRLLWTAAYTHGISTKVIMVPNANPHANANIICDNIASYPAHP